jgi:FAD/FMN-containing dehydrogenase
VAMVPRSPHAFAPLATRLRGELILPDDVGYDAAREVWNGAIDRRPAAILRARSAEDVQAGITFANESGLPIAVRSGGHSMAGHGVVDDGLVIDLAGLDAIQIDPDGEHVEVGGGVTAGAVTNALGAQGLAVPFGDTASVGVGGLTLGGGIGWLVRKHGLTIDHLESVEVVTADGRIVEASDTERSDLFWAIRGGGGNFGVVTRFRFRTVGVPIILGGALFLPLTRDVLRGLVPVAAGAPEELTTISLVAPIPPAPFIPQELHFTPAVIVALVWAGDPAEGQKVVDGLRALATPLFDAVRPMPYPAIYELTAQASDRHPNASRSVFLRTLDDRAVDALLTAFASPFGRTSMAQVRVLGGAMARVAPDATAFAHRDAAVQVMVTTILEGDPAPAEAWLEDLLGALAPSTSGRYVNFLADEGVARIRDAYPGGTWDRLAGIKSMYDPENRFRGNQNIPPA